MPRLPRSKSTMNTYHIMLRGIDKRKLFLDKLDYLKFMDYLAIVKENLHFTLYAYCLMSNHIHFLLNCQNIEPGDIIRKLAVRYAQYHNNKYSRIGHLFQNRFKSEPINDNRYFITVLRYIHQNPLKANIVKNLNSYRWSSYLDYIKKDASFLTDTDYGSSFFKNTYEFKEFMTSKNKDHCIDFTFKPKPSDSDVLKLILNKINIHDLKNLDNNNLTPILKNIKTCTNASNRQLSRILGINRNKLNKITL